jgi:uncharacterized membrane protein YhdT
MLSKILLAVVIGAIVGAGVGYFAGTFGYPGWVGGAAAGIIVPIIFIVTRRNT